MELALFKHTHTKIKIKEYATNWNMEQIAG
jgi:hypothetical protein